MAAAEARAVWQRTANRCFVQEDAKRAPKLACCQSSSSTSKQVDFGTTNTEETLDHRDNAGGFIPFPRNDFHNLTSETRWWLQLKPGFVCQRGLDTELEVLKGNLSDDKLRQEKCSDDGVKEKETVAMMSSYEFASVSKETDILSFDSVSSWSGEEKNEPWWRTTDKDDIASLVAKKSIDNVENCDLPPPQKVHVGGNPYSSLGCFEHKKMLESSLDWRPRKQGIRVGCPDLVRHMGMKWAASDEYEKGHQSGKAFSQKIFSNSVEVDLKIKATAWEGDPSKAELLEALSHSQTRAREAEKAANIANAEKEHIIKLFFRQASELFAYKLWFQLLQLESIKDTDQFPAFLPWTIKKGKHLRKSWNWRTGKWAVMQIDALAVAFGLGLVGAGLLLGWTVGWMLPPISSTPFLVKNVGCLASS